MDGFVLFILTLLLVLSGPSLGPSPAALVAFILLFLLLPALPVCFLLVLKILQLALMLLFSGSLFLA